MRYALTPIAVVGEEVLALLQRNLARAHTLRHPLLQVAHEFLRVVLHVVEHLLDGLALKHLVDAILAVLDGDMDGIGVAEQVVEVTENLLVGTDKEDTEIVGLLGSQAMDRQHVRDVIVGHEVGDLAVAIAGDVLDGTLARRTLVEALDRDDREELVNGPAIWQRLKE